MAEAELELTLDQTRKDARCPTPSSMDSLVRAKVLLMELGALIPQPETEPRLLPIAREILELGALTSIRLKDPEMFTRYYAQLQPFYNLPNAMLANSGGSRSKITGLYMMLLLTQHDYAGYHTLMETLDGTAASVSAGRSWIENDPYIQYPIGIERALMEGSYDKVWEETKEDRVPGEEFAIFSEILINTIRSEIATCSEKAYTSIALSNAKDLFFLESEGAVIDFSNERRWTVRDSRIFFLCPDQDGDNNPVKTNKFGFGASFSGFSDNSDEKINHSPEERVIEKTLSYANVLETIV